MKTDSSIFDKSHEEHHKEQIKRFARNTSSAQRLEWLEQALRFAYAAGIDCLAQKKKDKTGSGA